MRGAITGETVIIGEYATTAGVTIGSQCRRIRDNGRFGNKEQHRNSIRDFTLILHGSEGNYRLPMLHQPLQKEMEGQGERERFSTHPNKPSP